MQPRHAPINPLISGMSGPPIPQAQVWAAGYDGSHGPLINLSQAVPGNPPHPDLLARLASAAGSADAARYGAIEGDIALRRAYADDLDATYGAPFAPENVAITSGCNEAFAVGAMLVAQAGDSVIVPTPWYFNHQTTLAMMGITPIALPALPENGFILRAEDAAALIGERTRAIALVTPNNPTGAIYPRETIAAFARLCRERGIWLILDETYRDFIDGDAPPHALFSDDGWGENVIGLYSFSKSYAVPGHRLGAMTADPAIITQIAKILDNLQICPARAGQSAVAWAIPYLKDWRRQNRDDILARAEVFREAIGRHPAWGIETIGAFFAYLRHPFQDIDAVTVAERLARERGVLALPGTWFGPGQERYLRVAFANVATAQVAGLGDRLDGF
jgi:aspartate/methionine/tyrosine aminotransferase